MKILAIDTSCDETAVAITHNTKVVSNKIWSQAVLHASFGGVMPSLAQRQHQERIDYIVNRAMLNAKCQMLNIDAIAVTIGPGLGIALGVGINKAKELAIKYKLPLIPVNHVEGHLLSSFVNSKFPMLGLVLSGGTTMLCLVKNIGDYEILAETSDDALGEALDKAARLLGLGYPGGAILEKIARLGDPNKYKLPLPLRNDKIKNRFSYSGLKTALVRLFSTIKDPSKQDIYDLAASFQSTAFDHIIRVLEYHCSQKVTSLLFGGGVANNILLKSKLRKLLKKYNIKLHVPYTKKLNGDNAGMIGVTAYLKIKNQKLKLEDFYNYESVDRNPRLELGY
ncbi:tRNA (adenosine(37)-N6)-threonylcarbamoyltransferase complex transferase subunit TsaD [Candidatus Woesebacteria bacterium GWC2_33_12]|uniref:tRNA N6-adenosine threonylcarbamoyltransferase n=1 Tax=Candidatus Woesebacteria bacterium GW2011_GWB1_33_22 TaxID=1618566 RepID=A0A0F9ZJC0_9BACT|nr:MAG: putative tRNA threonylcarbamoyladenosine biosynthesis protein Gcp [Candidatus Woesebacteria bacterium GW2011_GWC2_33_12]KKP41819.1 MAG: putative tRNA threonylcarbamoyladenosine biosynthesis protein Gcp [Candidatus Woesebacteria bacterium GW2011_GWA2_33_20]KKP44323.1 MAG: putative tRNA threonylcarbamoyladenosine biosynthesis protein Gcp [Candidatus Woesebacteria bacterium GW2011_GWB1_33_22]KKP46081.1 MAG: putative tRNA threonylcarbamoyladenosine biosynthesis protein Gcp [Microgenomates gr